MPTPVTYPFDPTGLAATNLVTEEQHTLTSVNTSTYRLIVPKFAPFHVNNFEIVYVTMDGVETQLHEAVDFNFVFLYLGASRSIGAAIYGGISLLNELTDGYIKIKKYQTLGGDWCCNQQYVLEYLADQVFNPRTLPWDKITNVQQVFPPINHDQSMDWIKGHDDLIQAVNALADVIVNGGIQREQNLSLLIRNIALSADQVGLGNVQNLELATNQDIIDQAPLNKYVSLFQVIQLINNKLENLGYNQSNLTSNQISDFTTSVTNVLQTYLNSHPFQLNSADLQNIFNSVVFNLGAEFTDGVWVNKNGVLQQGVEGEDYPGLSYNNLWGKTQVPSRNFYFVSPVNNEITWDVSSVQVLRIDLTDVVNTFTVVNLNGNLVGTDLKLVIRNNGGNITWPQIFRFPNNTPPTLSQAVDKFDILTFSIETIDGQNLFLLNTGSSGNI